MPTKITIVADIDVVSPAHALEGFKSGDIVRRGDGLLLQKVDEINWQYLHRDPIMIPLFDPGKKWELRPYYEKVQLIPIKDIKNKQKGEENG